MFNRILPRLGPEYVVILFAAVRAKKETERPMATDYFLAVMTDPMAPAYRTLQRFCAAKGNAVEPTLEQPFDLGAARKTRQALSRSVRRGHKDMATY